MNVSFEEGLAVLEAIARNTSHSTVSQISSQTRFDEITVQETLRILETARYVSVSPGSSRVSLSPKLWSLGFCLKDPMVLKRVADRYLSELAIETRESACLGVIADNEIILVAGIDVPEPTMSGFEVGTKLRVCDCALGKAILAFQPAEVIGEVEKSVLPAPTPHGPEAFRSELELIRSRRYALHCDEAGGMKYEIAAPIHGAGDVVEAAVGISGPRSRLTPDIIPALAEHVLAAARAISRQLNQLNTGAP